jgi:NAD+ kinase
MPTAFSKVILFGKRHREKAIVTTLLRLIKHLENKKIEIIIEQETAEICGIKNYKTVHEDQLSTTKSGELIIVVGGDGSLLSAARAAASQHLPVLGINRGKLGFLTDIAPNALDQIDDILAGKYHQEKRFLLQTDVIRHEKIRHQQTALNDVVLLPGDIAHMIEFSIEIDQQLMCVQRADGLIIATPTGSTAYALSGGGPILHPSLDAVVLVPMFPHKLSSRPIVISGNSQINILINKQTKAFPRLSCDGQTRLDLKPEDSISIHKLPESLNLIHPIGYQYFATLRDKLQWESKPY